MMRFIIEPRVFCSLQREMEKLYGDIVQSFSRTFSFIKVHFGYYLIHLLSYNFLTNHKGSREKWHIFSLKENCRTSSFLRKYLCKLIYPGLRSFFKSLILIFEYYLKVYLKKKKLCSSIFEG